MIKRTKSAIQKLLIFLATRGLLVTLNQLAFLIVYGTDPASLHWYLFPYFMAHQFFMSLLFRVPFLLLEPKLHVITMCMYSFAQLDEWLIYVHIPQWSCKIIHLMFRLLQIADYILT